MNIDNLATDDIHDYYQNFDILLLKAIICADVILPRLIQILIH